MACVFREKAIRRGRVEVAIGMAHGLHGLDPAYVWRRLCSVVLEDVGSADLDLCRGFLWLASQRVWRREHGGERAFLYLLVEQMCRAPKDRTAIPDPWTKVTIRDGD